MQIQAKPCRSKQSHAKRLFIFCIPSADDALCVLPDPVAGPSEPRPAAVVPAFVLGARERDKREHGLLVRRRVRLRTRGRGLGGGEDRPGGAGGAGGAHGRTARLERAFERS
jgi:hypothetical protein